VAEFRSSKEFKEVLDRTFTLMSEDPNMGPQLRDADTPQRFEFTDLDLVVNVRAGAVGEPNLAWEWSDDVDSKPKVLMTMSSETANRYFQGKENVAIAIARRRIKAGGDVKAALAIIPITKPLYATVPGDDRGRLSPSGALTGDDARASSGHRRTPISYRGD
jgi:SCP-2 sterol transfer family